MLKIAPALKLASSSKGTSKIITAPRTGKRRKASSFQVHSDEWVVWETPRYEDECHKKQTICDNRKAENTAANDGGKSEVKGRGKGKGKGNNGQEKGPRLRRIPP